MPWPYDDEEQLRMAQAMRGGQVPPQQLVQPQQAQAGNAGPSAPFGSMPLPGPGGSARMGPSPGPAQPGADLMQGLGKAGQTVYKHEQLEKKAPPKVAHPDIPLAPSGGGIPGGAPPAGMFEQQPLPNQQLQKFAGYFAQGGPVGAQRPVVVGEQGPETFVPQQPGYIVPNPQTQQRPALPPGYTPPQPETASDAFDWRKERPLISPALQRGFSAPSRHLITPQDVMRGVRTKEELRDQTERFFGPLGGPLSTEKIPPDFSSVDMPRARAYGGPVDEDQPYTVGEQGPETFVPQQNQPGYVAHHSLPAGMTSGKTPPQQQPAPAPMQTPSWGGQRPAPAPPQQQPTPTTPSWGGGAHPGTPQVETQPMIGAPDDWRFPHPPNRDVSAPQPQGVPGGQMTAPMGAGVPGGQSWDEHLPRAQGVAEWRQRHNPAWKRGLIGAGIGAMSGAQGGLPGMIGGAAAGGIISAASRGGAANIARETIDIPQQDRRDARAHAATQEELKEQMQRAQIHETELRGPLTEAQTRAAQQNIDIKGEQAPLETAGIRLSNEQTAANTVYTQGRAGREEKEQEIRHGEVAAALKERETEAKTGAAESAADRGLRESTAKYKAAEDLRVQQEGEIDKQAQMHAIGTFAPDEMKRMQYNSIQQAQINNGAEAARKAYLDIAPGYSHDAERREALAYYEKLRAEGANVGAQDHNNQMARWVQMYRNEIRKNNGTVPDLHGKQFSADQVDAISKARGNSWDDQARILRHFGADVMDPGNVPHVAPAKSWWVMEQEEDEKKRAKEDEERKARKSKTSTNEPEK